MIKTLGCEDNRIDSDSIDYDCADMMSKDRPRLLRRRDASLVHTGIFAVTMLVACDMRREPDAPSWIQ